MDEEICIMSNDDPFDHSIYFYMIDVIIKIMKVVFCDDIVNIYNSTTYL
jgi:hypothetical protein